MEPYDGWCQGCHLPLVADDPDPPMAVLNAMLGNITGTVAPVRVPRNRLPEHGTLLSTTTGLLFVPRSYAAERDEHVHDDHEQAGVLKTVASLVLPRFGFLGNTATAVAEPRAKTSIPDGEEFEFDSNLSPADILMRHPGVFFIARESIRAIRQTSRCCWVDCIQRPSIKLIPLGSVRAFRHELRKLLTTEEWLPVPASARV